MVDQSALPASDLALLALGINHTTADITLRERVAFNPARFGEALESARDSVPLREVAILSTCNRTELYCVPESLPGARQRLLAWLADYHHLPQKQLTRSLYTHWGAKAARHMMRVAAGLDSMILGEPQILGQMKEAYAQAKAADTLGRRLNQVFQRTFAVAKKVRTDTGIGQQSISVAYASVQLARRIFTDLGRSHALLIGAGETIELVARHLREQGIGSIQVANRTLERAEQLAREVGGTPILLSEIPQQLPQADLVISSTASPLPILGKGAVERALKARRHRPIFMVDLAVPRDIEAEVAELADVYLYTVDDLQEVVRENLRSRQGAADEAERLITLGVEELMREERAHDAIELVKRYRGRAEQLQQAELEKARRLLAQGQDPQQVIERLAHGLTNKLLHGPTVQIKAASELDDREQRLAIYRDLFSLECRRDHSDPTPR
ncbi:MAG TPA: glutamyl-tRNA reductase [Pseudomonadales bacterium]|jgi:glutamyl-tRNA reductase|nr:glutamyl-tRNA reductase [Pseudomonadales bacterium]